MSILSLLESSVSTETDAEPAKLEVVPPGKPRSVVARHTPSLSFPQPRDSQAEPSARCHRVAEVDDSATFPGREALDIPLLFTLLQNGSEKVSFHTSGNKLRRLKEVARATH